MSSQCVTLLDPERQVVAIAQVAEQVGTWWRVAGWGGGKTEGRKDGWTTFTLA